MREPRIDAAKRKVKPVPSWKLVYESYTPLDEPWPTEVLPVILLSQGIIWAQGGNPDPAALCQIMAQTDHGLDTEATGDEELWDDLVRSLYALAWDDGESKRMAFNAAAGILAEVERKAERFATVSKVSVDAANEIIADLSVSELDRVAPEQPESQPEPHEDNANYDAVSDPTGLMCVADGCTQPAAAVIGDAPLCGFHYTSDHTGDAS